jgi:hypothetical protein
VCACARVRMHCFTRMTACECGEDILDCAIWATSGSALSIPGVSSTCAGAIRQSNRVEESAGQTTRGWVPPRARRGISVWTPLGRDNSTSGINLTSVKRMSC